MAYKPKVLEVAAGGTGASTLTGVLTGNGTNAVTANAITQHNVLVAGASNAISSVAPGTSGNILTSNGTDWTSAAAPSGGYNVGMRNITVGNPVDATTYFQSNNNFTSTSTSSNFTKFMIPKTGTITSLYGGITVQGTLGSAQNATITVRLNDTTDTDVTTTQSFTSASNAVSLTGLSIAVSAGDFVQIKITGPTWTTNPTLCSFTGYLTIT